MGFAVVGWGFLGGGGVFVLVLQFLFVFIFVLFLFGFWFGVGFFVFWVFLQNRAFIFAVYTSLSEASVALSPLPGMTSPPHPSLVSFWHPACMAYMP